MPRFFLVAVVTLALGAGLALPEVRGLLNQLAPYYDPDAAPLQSVAR